MSTSLLIVGAIAVFLAVFAVAYAVQSIVAERRQAYRTIQAIRAVELRPADLRNRELARPARDRLLKPFYNAALGLTRRFTPAGARDAIRRKLIQAGSPFGWTPTGSWSPRSPGWPVGRSSACCSWPSSASPGRCASSGSSSSACSGTGCRTSS